MIEERISKQRLEKLYAVDLATIENWVENLIIEINIP